MRATSSSVSAIFRPLHPLFGTVSDTAYSRVAFVPLQGIEPHITAPHVWRSTVELSGSPIDQVGIQLFGEGVVVATLCAILAHARLQALPGQDSNLDQRGQNPQCYRYTIWD